MAETHNEFSHTGGVPAVVRENNSTVSYKIPLHLLMEPPDAMRVSMDDEKLWELAQSIREVGLLQDLCVIPIGEDNLRATLVPTAEHVAGFIRDGGMFQVRAGHRRLKAMRSLNMDAAPCKVFCDAQSSEKAIMAHENSFREEPSDYELAELYRTWLQEPGLTEAELKRRAGKSLAFIYSRAELFEGWQFVAMALCNRQINFAVAKQINKEKDERYAKLWLQMAIDQGATLKIVSIWMADKERNEELAKMNPSVAPVEVVTNQVQTEKIECLACHQDASYLLRTAILCAHCKDEIKRLRDQQDRAATAHASGGD
jgi:ParB-like chromosome segregation protein Spo0J